MSKPTLLYCVSDGPGSGAAARGIAIANRLARRFGIVMLVEGALPSHLGLTLSREIEVVQIPVLGGDQRSGHASVDGSPLLSNDIAFGRESIRETYASLEPCVVVIENFPFGHSELGTEVMSMIANGKGRGSMLPLVVVSVADAISGGLRVKKNHDDKIAALLNERFDAVIVPSDPAFACLDEFFQPCLTLTTAVHHTGFVLHNAPNRPSAGSRERRVVVSAGDGSNGSRLCRAALEAHRELWELDRLKMTIVAGPSLRADEWCALAKAAGQYQGLTLERSVPDLAAEFAKVRWAVCPSDYDTACAVMATNVSALLVPGGGSDATQQIDRARKLASSGFCRILMAQHLNGASVANAIHRLVRFEQTESRFDLDGAKNAANLIQKLWISQNLRSMLRGLVPSDPAN